MVKKGVLIVGALALSLGISCKNTTDKDKSQQADKQKKTATKSMDRERVKSKDVYRGEYIFTDTAAVLKGSNFIYGVTLDSLSRDLGEKIKPMRNSEYDMVPVVVKGDLHDNGSQGWDQMLTIKKVLKVRKPQKSEALKISSKKNNNQ